ncbi:hypothetical protein [Pseudofrankia saprophytica]|uniref:hypothetical protein n=1 Tax=Pseudofrankia saprophytica TaxID=298655 RepID=UPI0012FF2AF1|nr:hypothetical protein [Pseudofrankia saprophytica]
MKKHLPIYVAIAAVAVIVFLVAGLPSAALVSLLLIAGCALMMFVMMRAMGMGGNDQDHTDDHARRTDDRDHDDLPRTHG